MSIHYRERRISNEWSLLQQVARLNGGLVEVLGRYSAPEDDLLTVAVHQTCGIVQTGTAREFVFSHVVELRFTRFFPSVPIEAALRVPVFHPNVDPENGFACLWNRVSASDTVARALQRLQFIISWTIVNLESAHLLQPTAAQWYQDPARQTALPLRFQAITWPDDEGLVGTPDSASQCIPPRRRLERISLQPDLRHNHAND